MAAPYSLHRIIVGSLMVAFLASCQPKSSAIPPDPPTSIQPGGSCGLGLPNDVSLEETLTALVAAEGAHVVAEDIDALMALWTQDSQVVNAHNTPNDSVDDQVWDGADALRHRYRYWVFPSRPSVAPPQDLMIDVVGDNATIRSTTHINNEIAPGGDLWELRKLNGCWYLARLTYNLEQ